MTPDDFARAFAYAFGDQNADALAELLTDEGTVQSLTGIWAKGARPRARHSRPKQPAFSPMPGWSRARARSCRLAPMSRSCGSASW